MFPPVKTADPQELLNNLWGCVQAAGPVFTQSARCAPKDDSYECSLQLAPGSLTPAVWTALTGLMRAYAKESGWKIERLSRKKGHIALGISLSSASSSTSKKR
jgi:hypothetical protein